ncbi:unnamed protein product [Nezara viridula]|uniref:Lipase domain-containing protein n=1 Tax=Nezara viridula TaxID=85310 RepID=A0A9P0MWQ4_NEZVI|nr:unnamed protein product [Nezara viridula]
MAIIVKKFTPKALDAMFFRVVSPKNKVECNKEVVPDLLLEDVRIIDVSTTDAGSQCDWTFKSADVALIDEARFPSLKNTINKDLKNVCLVPGFYESVNSLSVRTFMNGYLERGDHNVFLLDWSVMGKILYTRSYFSLNMMAERTVEALKRIEGLELIKLDDFHIVGNSMGAHLGSCISRKLGSVRRLTGLDPAGPFFSWDISKNVRISKRDAKFVDIIHTDTKRFGLGGKLGHADFYPNAGIGLQPGCKTCYSLELFNPKRFCSHWRCWRYYCESLGQEDAFLAAAANSWEDFKKGNTGNVIPMGYSTPPDTSGIFFLQTSHEHPYGRGEDGLKYSEETC